VVIRVAASDWWPSLRTVLLKRIGSSAGFTGSNMSWIRSKRVAADTFSVAFYDVSGCDML
jgi:hypothetical protein